MESSVCSQLFFPSFFSEPPRRVLSCRERPLQQGHGCHKQLEILSSWRETNLLKVLNDVSTVVLYTVHMFSFEIFPINMTQHPKANMKNSLR